MAITVPQLDKTVFTPGQPRDYVSHALQIASMYPNYGKMIQDARMAEMQRQALQLKYETDLQKAQQFLDLYPDYRDAQIAVLRSRAAQANATAATLPELKAAQSEMFRAHAQRYRDMNNPGVPPEFASELGGELPAPPGASAPAAPPAAAPAAPAQEAAPDTGGNIWQPSL